MAKKPMHVKAGVLTGAGLAAYRAREQKLLDILLEAVGGGVGGYFGGRLPDIIEPALWPGHRQFAHSVTAGTGIIVGFNELLEMWEKWCRSKSQYFSNRNDVETMNLLRRVLYAFLEMLFRIGAGTLSGLGAGYLSHLVLDGQTPNGLPLL
jgi:membrane-bound metal-dependent hydrolase YbcI (DUF457 family)